MGKFIVSRTAAGDRFILQTELGYTLATSRVYATLDACKKGIASLVANAPTVPVRDVTAGERGPNPKFEITATEGAYRFVLKSANGRSVIESGSFATKKACLRAISMLRTGVASAEVLFEQKGGLVPLQIKALESERSETAISVPQGAPAVQEPPQTADEPLFDAVPAEELPEAEAPEADVTAEAEVATPPAPTAPPAPRLVRVKPAPVSTKPKTIFAPARKPTPPKPPKKRSLLDILLKK